MRRTALALAVLGVCLEARGDDPELRERARAALRKAVLFYRTQVATEGGYHFHYAHNVEALCAYLSGSAR
jgi:hypothetical protein